MQASNTKQGSGPPETQSSICSHSDTEQNLWSFVNLSNCVFSSISLDPVGELNSQNKIV